METLDLILSITYVVVNVFAIVQVVGSYRWPTVTRVVFFLIFAIAAFINIRTVLDSPWVYQSYAYYAVPLYSRFILGPFEFIIQPMVLTIALGQAFIAVSMFMKQTWFQMGCLFGIIFCVAIAPLGFGAAFPATLLMAFALYRLVRHEDRKSVGDVISHSRLPLPLD